MKLARKSLLQFIDGPVDIKEEDVSVVENWQAKDLGTFTILSAMISPQYQTMIQNATSTAQLWTILKEYFVRKSLHNRVEIRRRLHDLKMDRGTKLVDHMMKFDKLTMEMAAIGDALNDQEMLVILLGSLVCTWTSIRSYEYWRTCLE